MVAEGGFLALRGRRQTPGGGGAGCITRQIAMAVDIQRLPLDSHSMDLVVSNLTLQWCGDLKQTLTDIARILAPGGLLLFSTFGSETLSELRSSWADVDDHVHVNDFVDLHDVGDAMAMAGLRDVVVDVDRITVHHPTLLALMRQLKAMGAHNVNRGRPRGLTGRRSLERLAAAYEQYRTIDGLPASYEVVYGHAWGRDDPNAIAVPFTSPKAGRA